MSEDDVTRQVLTLSDCTVYTGRSCSQSPLPTLFFFLSFECLTLLPHAMHLTYLSDHNSNTAGIAVAQKQCSGIRVEKPKEIKLEGSTKMARMSHTPAQLLQLLSLLSF